MHQIDPTEQTTPVRERPQHKAKIFTPLFFIFVGATLALIALLLILLPRGGKVYGRTPENVVRDFVDTHLMGDLQASAECLGHDYAKTKADSISDPRSFVEDFRENYFNESAWQVYGNVGMDRDAWMTKLDQVSDAESFSRFYIDFHDAYKKCLVEVYGIRYEILQLEITPLEGEAFGEPLEYFDTRYQWKQSRNYTILYEREDVEAFYAVDLLLSYEERGVQTEYSVTMLVVETSVGSFIVYEDLVAQMEIR